LVFFPFNHHHHHHRTRHRNYDGNWVTDFVFWGWEINNSGASDNIFEGQSTFLVELQETSTILKESTNKSLIILDELGRGTSTYDGYSIAYATLSHLAQFSKSAVLFSTHYHLLTDELQLHPNISLNYMSCFIDEELLVFVFLCCLNCYFYIF
jgi:DNA mismatch repair ATPase MutS